MCLDPNMPNRSFVFSSHPRNVGLRNFNYWLEEKLYNRCYKLTNNEAHQTASSNKVILCLIFKIPSAKQNDGIALTHTECRGITFR